MESTFFSLMHGFAVAMQPGMLWYAFLGCIVGTLVSSSKPSEHSSYDELFVRAETGLGSERALETVA